MTAQHAESKPEDWRPIPGYEGVYEAGTSGQVRRVGDAVLHGEIVSRGYCRVWLGARRRWKWLK